MHRAKRFAFVAVTSALLLVAVEVFAVLLEPLAVRFARIEMRPLREELQEQSDLVRRLLDDTTALVRLDSLVGWTYRPGYTSPIDTINAHGLRGSREYAPVAATGILRVAAFGDSFIYGTEVASWESWTAQLESIQPNVDVLNYGVGGYGTDQAFLRYQREGAAFAPTVVIIGFTPDNLRRAVNVYRRFITTAEYPLVKPRFTIDSSNHLRLIPVPLTSRSQWEDLYANPEQVRALGAHDAWYDRFRYEHPLLGQSTSVRLIAGLSTKLWRKSFWSGRLLSDGVFRPDTEAFRIQTQLLLQFAEYVRAEGKRPIIVLFPERESVTFAGADRPPVYAPLRDALRRHPDLEIIDLLEPLQARAREIGVDSLFAPDVHYSSEGNRVVATTLAVALRAAQR